MIPFTALLIVPELVAVLPLSITVATGLVTPLLIPTLLLASLMLIAALLVTAVLVAVALATIAFGTTLLTFMPEAVRARLLAWCTWTCCYS